MKMYELSLFVLVIVWSSMGFALSLHLRNSDVFDRQLVHKKIGSVDEILDNHEKFCLKCIYENKFKGSLFGHVNPMENISAEISESIVQKFNYLVGESLDLDRIAEYNYRFRNIESKFPWTTGSTDESATFNTVLARCFFRLNEDAVNQLLWDVDEAKALGKFLVHTAKRYKFGGYVFELDWLLDDVHTSEIAEMLETLTEHLHSNEKKLFISTTPPLKYNKDEYVTNVHMTDELYDRVKDVIDGLIIVTYGYFMDHSTLIYDGPVDYVENNVRYYVDDDSDSLYRQKIYFVINLSGIRYVIKEEGDDQLNVMPEHIDQQKFIDILKANKDKMVIRYNKTINQHIFDTTNDETGDKFIMFYPTLYSIHKRISLARKLNTGIYVFNLNHGLEYFYDLF